jgi:eukaryotic-like serine/threonine-protein kinase
MGSPPYAAPEQLRSALDVDARTDQWGLGVTLYELLTGVAPFGAETLPEMVARTLESTPQPIRALRPEVPEPLERAVLRCLEKDRSARFADVAELAAALAPFAAGSRRDSAARIRRTLAPVELRERDDEAELSRASRATPMSAVGTAVMPASPRPVWRGVASASIAVLVLVGGLVALRHLRPADSVDAAAPAPAPILAAAGPGASPPGQEPQPEPSAVPEPTLPPAPVVTASPRASAVTAPPRAGRATIRRASSAAARASASAAEPSAPPAPAPDKREAWDMARFGGRE